ncbi:hypothetical protein [Brevundimonas sp.]|jgi:hypothetical protein|uniref:hypothetical protein n=1 Tax=Brevundimonas sp. TaxID=1871086 RepID=UPI0037845498
MKEPLCTCERPDYYCDCLLYDEKVKEEPKISPLVEELTGVIPEQEQPKLNPLLMDEAGHWDFRRQERTYSDEDLELRKRLWVDVYIAYVSTPNSYNRDGGHVWADKALERFDEQFKNK